MNDAICFLSAKHADLCDRMRFADGLALADILRETDHIEYTLSVLREESRREMAPMVPMGPPIF